MSWEVWTMKSRTSCSEMSLFRRCLQRYWPFWLGMAAVMVLFYVLPLANMLSDPSRPQVASGNLGPVQIFVYGHMDTCLLYALLFGLIAAMLVFEHTYSTKLTGLFASLPVKRGRIFAQHWLAGAVMLLSTGLLIALALLAVEAVYGAADLPSALTFLAVWSMESLTFYGLAAFCVMLTGHVLVIPALYLLLNFAGSALNMMLGGLVTSYSYGVMGGANGLDWLHTLSPVVRLMTECGQGFGPNGESTGFIGWGWVIGYFIVGLAFTAIAQAPERRPGARAKMLEFFARCAVGVVRGQVEDIAAGAKDVPFIYEHKTADLFMAAAVTGALAGGGDDASVEKLRLFAYHLGVAFQYEDDLLDDDSPFPRDETARRVQSETDAALAALAGLPGDAEPLVALARNLVGRTR